MNKITAYLNEIQRPKNLHLVISKNDLNAPLFKWRNILHKDIYKKFCDNKPCSLISYSWVDDDKTPKWKRDTTCAGGMVLIENPNLNKTEGYKVNVIIVFIFIEEAYRKMGLGGELIKKVISKYKKVFLTTDKSSSDVAKKMYKKYGFRIIKTKGKLDHWVIGV